MAGNLVYRVEVLGGGLRGAKPDEFEYLLNEYAGQGWRLHSFCHQPNSNRMWVVFSSSGEGSGRRSRSSTDWSLNWG